MLEFRQLAQKSRETIDLLRKDMDDFRGEMQHSTQRQTKLLGDLVICSDERKQQEENERIMRESQQYGTYILCYDMLQVYKLTSL